MRVTEGNEANEVVLRDALDPSAFVSFVAFCHNQRLV